MKETRRLSTKLHDYVLHNPRICWYFYGHMSNDKSHRVTRHSVWHTKVVIQKVCTVLYFRDDGGTRYRISYILYYISSSIANNFLATIKYFQSINTKLRVYKNYKHFVVILN